MPSSERARERRRDELPGRNAGGARHHEFEPPRQREIAGHGADQDAERHQLFEQLRHAEQRGLRDRDRGGRRQARGLADHLDVVDQHEQHEDAGEHADRRDHEAAGKIAPERVGHHAHAAAGRPNSRSEARVRSVDRLHQRGRRFDHDAADDHPQADADRSRTASDIGAARRHGDFTAITEQANPAMRRPNTARIDAADRKIAALARGARRAEEREGQRREGKRIDRRHEAVMQLGAELAGQLLVDRIVRGRREQLPEIAFANAVA